MCSATYLGKAAAPSVQPERHGRNPLLHLVSIAEICSGVKTAFAASGQRSHDAGCFHTVIDEDIRFAVNLDPGFVNGFEGNRPKWFLPYFFQDTLDRHAISKTRQRCRIQAANLESGS
jgi:hypothetical protein